MIDPLETAIQYLKGQSTALGTAQIASKHKYGDSWEAGSDSIVVRLDGGPPDHYVPVFNARLEVRCFGADEIACIELMLKLLKLVRDFERTRVTLEGDDALMYALNRDSGISMQWDPELKMDFCLGFFEVKVGEEGI